MLRVAVFAALPWECKCVLPVLRDRRRGKSGSIQWWEGEAGACHVRVVQTGVGMMRATAAARVTLSEFPCQLVVSTGCAGGLSATLGLGAVVIASEVVCGITSSIFPVSERLVASLTARTSGSGLHCAIGRQLSVAEPLVSVAAKQQAAIRFQALAVDMESAAIAREAKENGIAFASVRAILDPALASLPPTEELIDPESGRVQPWPLIRKVLRSGPDGWRSLHELYAWKQAAGATLSRFYQNWFSAGNMPALEGKS